MLSPTLPSSLEHSLLSIPVALRSTLCSSPISSRKLPSSSGLTSQFCTGQRCILLTTTLSMLWEARVWRLRRFITSFRTTFEGSTLPPHPVVFSGMVTVVVDPSMTYTTWTIHAGVRAGRRMVWRTMRFRTTSLVRSRKGRKWISPTGRRLWQMARRTVALVNKLSASNRNSPGRVINILRASPA